THPRGLEERAAPEFARIAGGGGESNEDRRGEDRERDGGGAIPPGEQQVAGKDRRRELQAARQPDCRALPAKRVRTAEVIEDQRGYQNGDLPVAKRRPDRLEPDRGRGCEQRDAGGEIPADLSREGWQPQREAQRERQQHDVPSRHHWLERSQAEGAESGERD